MKKYHISPLELNQVDNSSLAQLLTSTNAVLLDFTRENREEQFYTLYRPTFEDKIVSYERNLHKVTSSEVTLSLADADRERDQAYTTITKLIRAYSSVPTEPIASSYQLLSALIKNYKITTKTNYEKESEILRNLLKELEQDKYQSAIEALHLNDPIERLQNAQRTFDRRYSQQIEASSEKIPGQTLKLRKELLNLYTLIIDYTAVTATAFPEKTSLTKLREDLNAIRKRYKTSNTDKESSKPEPPSET